MWIDSEQADRQERGDHRGAAVAHQRHGTPVIGMIPRVMPTLTKTWNISIARIPPAISVPNRFLASGHDPQRPPDQQRVQDKDDRGADEAVGLADDREDEVRVGAGRKSNASGSHLLPRPVF